MTTHNYFEEYLKNVHAKQYAGTDDDMPDDFENWLSELDTEEIAGYAEDAIQFEIVKQKENLERQKENQDC